MGYRDFSAIRYTQRMQIFGYCAIRGCDDHAAELVAGLALCRRHVDLLASALKTPVNFFREMVYYVGWRDSGLVKIGTTTRMRTRMHALSSGPKGRAHLLAAEPGSYSTERTRHRAFRSARKTGTELFQLTPQIHECIDGLRKVWPHWLDMSGVGPEWLSDEDFRLYGV